MNQILLSFLCGAAFIGGATATTILVILVNGAKSKDDREALKSYWRESVLKHTAQIAVLERIAAVMENSTDKKNEQ